MTYRLYRLGICLATVVALFPAGLGWSAESLDPAAVLEPFVNDDTFVAAYLDLAALPEQDASEEGNLLKLLPYLSDDAQVTIMMLQGIGRFVEILRGAGVDAVYLVAGLADVNTSGGPIIIFDVGAGGKPEQLVRMFAPIAPLRFRSWKFEVEMRTHGQGKVLVGSPATLERYTSLAKKERPDLMGPLEKLSGEGAVVAAVVCPGPDFRRVVRELWPELPGSLAPLRGELADRWLHLELAANVPPDVKPRLALQARDSAAAETFVDVLRAFPNAAEELSELGERRHELKDQLEMILDVLSPQQDGSRITITLPTDEPQLDKLRPLISGAADAAMESTRGERRRDQFKQISLALLNYESAKKRLPPAAIRDKEGQPLLSWRVAVLPYLEERELYIQFHLDEPWDSPHNRTLIEKMPAVYADPDPRLKQLAREGKTTYQVPVAPETIFHSAEGTTYREISDGTAKTIMLVEVEPLRAVAWTKPEDWEVNVQQPLRGVERSDRRVFVVAFADAHIESIPVDVDFKKLRGLLTRGGSEVFDWP